MTKEKIIGGIVIFIVLTLAAAVGGQFVGSIVFGELAKLPDDSVGILTLWQYAHSKYMANALINRYVKIGFLVSGIITIFPTILMIIVAIISREKKELHGSTRWAKAGEIASYGLLPSPKQLEKARKGLYPDVIIGAKIGVFSPKYLRFCSNEFALLAAGTRQGKGISFVVPNCLNFVHSLVCYDPKMENYLLTSGFRGLPEKNGGLGQKIFLFNPAGTMPSFDQMDNPEARLKAQEMAKNAVQKDGENIEFLKSHRWNPYHYISRNPKHLYADLHNMANILYPLPSNDVGNAGFFARTAQKLFIGLSMYMIETENNRPDDEYQDKTSLSLLAKLLTPKDTSLSFEEWVKYRLLGLEPDDDSGITFRPPRAISQTCANLLREVVVGEEKTSANIKTSFSAPLAIFNDPIVSAATSENDFDFRDLRRQKMSIFVAIQPNDLDRFQVLTNLFFSQLINENIKQGLPEHNSQLKYQTLLLIDEFTLLGYMSVFQKGVSFIAGYNLRLALVFQVSSQVESVYKHTGMTTFFSNFTTQTIFAEKNHNMAKQYSDLIGHYTMKVKSSGRSSGKGGGSRSTNISEQARALLNADEIKTLPFEKCVVTMTGKRPMFVNKIMYYKEKEFKDKVKYSPYPAPDLEVAEPELLAQPMTEEEESEWFADKAAEKQAAIREAVENNLDKVPQAVKSFVGNHAINKNELRDNVVKEEPETTAALLSKWHGSKKALQLITKYSTSQPTFQAA